MLGKGRTEHSSVFRSSSRSHATHAIGELKNSSGFTNTLNVSFLRNSFMVVKNRRIILSLPVKDEIVGHILYTKISECK